MKKNLSYLIWKNILYIPLFLLLIASIATTSVMADPELYLFVDPPSATINAVGQNVTVVVNVTEVTACGGFDIRISYNQTLLNYTKNSYTVDGPGQVFPTTGTRNFFDVSSPGDLYLSLTLAYPNTLSGSGRVVWITFEGLMEGVSELTFNSDWTFIFDEFGDPQPMDPPVGGEITVIPEFPAAIATLLLIIITLAATLLGKTVWSRKHAPITNKTN